MSLPSVESSIVSIFHSLSFLDSLQFPHSKTRVASAALADLGSFEGKHIRDAEEHERGLFRANAENPEHSNNGKKAAVAALHDGAGSAVDRDRLRRSILGRSTNARNMNNIGKDTSWTFAKRRGPERTAKPETATPLKRRRPNATTNNNNKDGEDPEAYLLAARKLLKHYSGSGTSMTRAQEHVELLYSQYEGLIETIADLQEELDTPLPKHAASAIKQDEQQSVGDDVEALEAEIRREELEIFALKELKAEREKESRDLDAALEARRPSERPLPKQNRFRPPVPATANAATTAKSTSTRSAMPSAAAEPAKKEPSAVARKIAEARQKMAAKSSSPDVQDTSPSTANMERPQQVQASPSVLEPLQDADATPRKAVSSASSAVKDMPIQQRERPKPAIPELQLEAIVAKIVSTFPPGLGAEVKDARTVLAELITLINQNTNADAVPPSTLTVPLPLTPVQCLEYHLLHIYLSLLLSLPPPHFDSTPVLIFRTPATSTSQKPEPMLSLNAIKTSLAEFAKGHGWNEDLGTKAVYGLVAKRVVKIDRSGRESLVGFTL